MESVEKVFSPARFEGQDVLRKRHFTRKPVSKGKVEFSYKGRSAVVVSSNTPFIFYFNLNIHTYIHTYVNFISSQILV